MSRAAPPDLVANAPRPSPERHVAVLIGTANALPIALGLLAAAAAGAACTWWLLRRRPSRTAALGRHAGGDRGRGVQQRRLARPARADPRRRRLHPDRQGGLRRRPRPHRHRPPRPGARRGDAHEPHDRCAARALAAVVAAAGAGAGRSLAARRLRGRGPAAPLARPPVEVEIEPGLAATGDPTLLRMVLENLLGNAWKYTGNTEPARIAFLRHPNEPATFTVRDNGAGFDMRFADRLFGAFQRLHSASEFPGTGHRPGVGAPHRPAPWRRDPRRGRAGARRELPLLLARIPERTRLRNRRGARPPRAAVRPARRC